MTEHQKNKLLRQIRHMSMTRVQLESFCTGQTPLDREREIDALCAEKMVHMVSRPYFKQGTYIPRPDDLFVLSDCGKDYLSNIKKEHFRFYLPIMISTFSLLVALASFVVSVIALTKAP